MKYAIRVNKRVRNFRVYKVLKKTSGNVKIVTKIFIRIFSGRKKEEEV